METLTAGQVTTTIYVILVVFGAIITVDKVLDIIRKWRTPAADIGAKLDKDKRRLDEHEAELEALKNSAKLQCTALLALLDHELHNGNADQMQTARDDLVHYLASK